MPGKKAKRSHSSAVATSAGPLMSQPQAKDLLKLLTKTKLNKRELESTSEMLATLTQQCQAALEGRGFNKSEMKEWEENWKEVLTVAAEEYAKDYTPEKIAEFVKAVSESIVTVPTVITYEVIGKHSSVIQYELFAFETKEADGTRQKILADRYRFISGYDESEGWALTSEKDIEKSFSFQEHLAHIDPFRVPKETPQNDNLDDLFWNEDEGLGFAAFYNRISESELGDILPLDEVLKQKKKWQIVLGMTSYESHYS